MLDMLKAAINNRKYISFMYSNLFREAQPVALGISRAGNEVLRCYQTKGSHVTPGHEWDFCDLSKICDLRVLDENFQDNPPGYRKGDKHMILIHAEL